MKQSEYELIKSYMELNTCENVHDRDHIDRVLFNALEIAKEETGVDYDVLITACLLHDIGRINETTTPPYDHAIIGADKAWVFLNEEGFPAEFAKRVCHCIRAHRFREDTKPETLEAKILFDADKLDVAGTMGIARTLLWQGRINVPLYYSNNNVISTEEFGKHESFLSEYQFKLKKIYSGFYTKRGKELAEIRRTSAENFYNSFFQELVETYKYSDLLSEFIKEN